MPNKIYPGLLWILILPVLAILVSCSNESKLEWIEEGGYRWAEVSMEFFGRTGFKELSSSKTNIHFLNDVTREQIKDNRNYLNGSGVAAADVDGDGWIDLFFAGLDTPNKLYKNEKGFRFRDITEEAGLIGDHKNSTGAVFEDVNGDGYPDLLITSFQGDNVLYINDGTGKFSLKENSGLGQGKGAMTMALADIDGDGDLDLYITNYKVKSVRDMYSERELDPERTMQVENGTYVLRPPFDEYYEIVETDDGNVFRNEFGTEDELYLNDGTGQFTKADPKTHFFDREGKSTGLDRDWGLAAKFQDLNGDGAPDLFVANDFWTPDRVWMNRGDGTFEPIGKEAVRNYSFSSMGVDFSDIDNDGFTDIFITEMLSPKHRHRLRHLSDFIHVKNHPPQYNRNSLYLNRGDNTFAEISYFSGLESTGWSWAARFLDVDLDGYEDVLITTGYGSNYQDIDANIMESRESASLLRNSSEPIQYPSLELPNVLLRNRGNLQFEDMSTQWWEDTPDISHGLITADLDNDGDLDLVTNRSNRTAAIYENRTKAGRVAVRLKGSTQNTRAIGATIKFTGPDITQTRQVTSGGDYLSGPDLTEVFAASEENGDYSIEIIWPGGKVSEINNVKTNRIYEINESIVVEDPEVQFDMPTPFFEDISRSLDHTHHENSYNDFRVSPLLPFKLSRQGPGVAWLDIYRDGRDDLVVTSGLGGELSLFENSEDGSFTKKNDHSLTREAPGDQTSVIGWQTADKSFLIIGSANYEQGNPNVASAMIFQTDVENTEMADIPGILSTTGPLAAADINGDGEMDLFVGGRFVPGQYPVSADSRLFLNNEGRFIPDQANNNLLKGVGLVTGAVFTDYNLDGQPDLLLSTEWGSLKLFENREGTFQEVTREVGLDSYKGIWNGVATGDFNNDGRPDIIATNIGENSIYQIRNDNPLRLYYDDLNGDGRLDVVDAYYSADIDGYVPRRHLFNYESISSSVQHINSHREFARLPINEVFNTDFSEVPYKEVNTLHTTVFLNTGESYIPVQLPPEVQFSTAFFAGTADFDNDGHEDIFLSQNTSSGHEKDPRQDAGRGLWLQGDGTGNFRTVPGQESGIRIYGSQRGAALGDFNGDGKVDVAVSQNGSETKLYKNKGDKRGLRIRLRGNSGNRNAIGAGIRLVYEDGSKGPRREIQAGSGYASQNSVVQILGYERTPQKIEVTWPDGLVQETEVTSVKTDYEIVHEREK